MAGSPGSKTPMILAGLMAAGAAFTNFQNLHVYPWRFMLAMLT